jgi:AcrR family transcriptional regulator
LTTAGGTSNGATRPLRADAKRNVDAVLEAAKTAFATTGVLTPVREIAALAGVGTGTLYRHFPLRADLVSAVFRRELDACADAAAALASTYEPIEALERWLARYVELLSTKHGLITAMHSDAPTYESLTECLQEPLRPGLRLLLDNASRAGLIRPDTDTDDLLQGVAALCLLEPAQTQRLVALMIDGLRLRER